MSNVAREMIRALGIAPALGMDTNIRLNKIRELRAQDDLAQERRTVRRADTGSVNWIPPVRGRPVG